MDDCRFKYYVLNDDFNEHRVEPFNIFRNHYVNSQTIKAVRKYLRSPSKFEFKRWGSDKVIYGFEAFVETINLIIKCEEWARCEYEIMVNGLFSDEDCAQKIDCYTQCKPNMEMIAREVIYQYKTWLKENKE